MSDSLVPPGFPVRTDTGSFSGSGALKSRPVQPLARPKSDISDICAKRFIFEGKLRVVISGLMVKYFKDQHAKGKFICKEKREGQAPPF
jgi:hypothetical protein